MKKALFLCLILTLMAVSSSFAQYLPIFSQSYSESYGAYPSTLDLVRGFDYETADNFSDLSSPITKCEFYGQWGALDTEWTQGYPNPLEPLKVKFYALDEGWTEPPAIDPGILAPTTGTYTVNLYDSWGDGWDEGMLDVYVNGVQILEGLTLENGEGPATYSFPANAGEYILTVYTRGSWGYENWYQILDPSGALLAQDGDNTQTIFPTGIGSLISPFLLAETTGTYTVNLYDTGGDGWNGGLLDVYVNGNLILNHITLANGSGPESHTFAANAGDEIATIFTPGGWVLQNWYEILDPNMNQIAQDGDNTQTAVADGLGFISTFVCFEPDWQNPLYSFDVDATVTHINTWGTWMVYKFEAVLPAAISLTEGWISVQNDAVSGSGWDFLWIGSAGSDDFSYLRYGAKSAGSMNVPLAHMDDTKATANPTREVLMSERSFRLYTDAPTEIVVSDDPETLLPAGVTISNGGTIPDELMGPDSGLPMVLYTIEATGTWDVVVHKPADWNTDWNCWINVGGALVTAPNPIPVSTLSYTFAAVDFGAKSPATVVINDNQTLPVELSSFAAVLTSDMFVNIAWVSQSETNHLGYNILRGLSNDAATAIKLNDIVICDGEQLGTQMSYSYLDNDVESGSTYWYWLESVNLSGSMQLFGPISVMVNGDPDDPETPELPPTATTLLPAFPNPFNPNTNIRYYLMEASGVKIDIYNTKGQLVRSFTNTHAIPGFYQLGWDGKDTAGNLCSSGIYMYRMKAGKYASSRRMVLAK